MTDSLFQQLERIGIDEDLACQVSASLDPDHNASKKDVLVLQNAILQVQAKSDERYYQLREDSNQQRTDSNQLRTDSNQLRTDSNQLRTDSNQKYHELKHKLIKGLADLRIEIHSMHRHSIYAFGAILVSIFSVLAVDIYFHL